MAALRGRSLDFLGGAGWGGTGFDFCASDSGTLGFGPRLYWRGGNGRVDSSSGGGGGVGGGRAAVASGLAMELSGIPELRGGAGGGGTDSKE